MPRKFCFELLAVYFVSLFFGGCALFLVGAGVGGGLAISKDTIQIELDSHYDRSWGVVLSEINKIGTVTSKDKAAGIIEAKVRGSRVRAVLSQVTPKTTRVRVKSRKNLLPNIDLANEIGNSILRRF